MMLIVELAHVRRPPVSRLISSVAAELILALTETALATFFGDAADRAPLEGLNRGAGLHVLTTAGLVVLDRVEGYTGLGV